MSRADRRKGHDEEEKEHRVSDGGGRSVVLLVMSPDADAGAAGR